MTPAAQKQNTFPARLHVLLARESPVGLVIRRGPAQTICTIGWDRTNDTFQLGQWMRGRLYERRSDLSPDGQHFIYFARNFSQRTRKETKGTWTAISKVPYLKAITLFGKGDCWCGGGLFLSNKKYWINGMCGHFEIRSSKALKRDERYQPPAHYGGECLTGYFNRLQRDGWSMRGKYPENPAVFEKPLPKAWTLRKHAHAGSPRQGSGCYWDTHELLHPAKGTCQSFPAWEWADLDRQRLLWATKGKLWTAELGENGLEQERLLFDFNGMKFERIVAPY